MDVLGPIFMRTMCRGRRFKMVQLQIQGNHTTTYNSGRASVFHKTLSLTKPPFQEKASAHQKVQVEFQLRLVGVKIQYAGKHCSHPYVKNSWLFVIFPILPDLSLLKSRLTTSSLDYRDLGADPGGWTGWLAHPPLWVIYNLSSDFVSDCSDIVLSGQPPPPLVQKSWIRHWWSNFDPAWARK